MYEAIVVGTDGSETAKRAVDEATRLAEAMGGQLHIVAAYEPLRGAKIVGAPKGAAKVWEVKPDAKVQGVIQEAESTARMKGVEVEAHTLTGDPADALLEIAAKQNADLDRGWQPRHAWRRPGARQRPEQGLPPGPLQRAHRRHRRRLSPDCRGGTCRPV